MKKWLIYIAIFVFSYLAFLMATAPLSLVVNNIDLPSNVEIQGVSGSIWQGEISRATLDNNIIEEIKVDVSFWSLFSLSPNIDVAFGNPVIAGPEGKFSLSISSEELALTDVELYISASEVVNQLTLPIPVSAQGNVEVNIPLITFATGDKLSCLDGQGAVTWLRSGVIALEQNVKLGDFNAEISCNQGNIITKVKPDNNVGLSFDGILALPSKKASGNGYIKPGNKFPSELKSVLPFLGRADKQGRYYIKL